MSHVARLPHRARPRQRSRTTVTAALLALFAVVSAGAAAAGPYPDPPPDFPDREPHTAMFSPRGGQTDRPMLVIFAEFADVTFDDTADPPDHSGHDEIDAAYLHDRFFGPAPSVAGYFAAVSGGDLTLTPAPDTDTANDGAVDDGVVSVSIDMDKGEFLELGREAEQARLLQAADAHVDYAAFDRDGDGRIAQDELVVVRQDVDDDPVAATSGGTTRRPEPVTLDGVRLGGTGGVHANDDLAGVDVGTDTNLMTIVHELGHAAFDMPDTYFWGTGALDLAGPTGGADDLELFHPNAWQKLHLGWTEPTVVTEDGYYDVARSPVGTSFILYDPERGTDDYFIVENRQRRPEATDGSGTFTDFVSYDQGASDTGLVIWRVDESQWDPAGGGEGFISLIPPGGVPPGNGHGGSDTDAWDPSDPDTPQDAMAGVAWRDGTPSNVAVRSIPAAGDDMRVYFDVAGPGVMVEPITTIDGRPLDLTVTPGEANRFRVPITNTGEATDTFTVSFDDLPPGWDSEADEVTLDAGEEGDALPAIVPAADAATGAHPAPTVVAASTTDASVAERAPFGEVTVVLDITDVAYTGATEGVLAEPAGFAARVTNASDGGAPVVGVEVTFDLSGPGGALTATATTGDDGVAAADPLIDLPPGDYQLDVATDRFGKHAPSGDFDTTYHVLTAAERVADLRDDVVDAGLAHGIETSLTVKLDRTLAHLDADRPTAACETLQAFAHEIAAQSGRHIPPATAGQLGSEAAGIRDQLGCGS